MCRHLGAVFGRNVVAETVVVLIVHGSREHDETFVVALVLTNQVQQVLVNP